jgi:H+/Cl- antiporter ClcA
MVTFRFLIFSQWVKDFNPLSPIGLILISILYFLSIYSIKIYPAIRGSGVPQTKAYLNGIIKFNWKIEMPLKLFFISALNLIGLSIGSAGPAIQIGGYIGTIFNTKEDKKNTIFSGVSALGAFLGAPVTGILLAYEEFDSRFNIIDFLKLILMVGASYLVKVFIFGTTPLFNLYFDYTKFKVGNIILPTLFIIIFSIILGKLFRKFILNFGRIYKNDFLKIIPFLLLFPILYYLPVIKGGGAIVVNSIISDINKYGFLFLATLLIIKYLYTLLCATTSIPAGLIMPTISLGALIGATIWSFFNINVIYLNFCIILGISVYFYVVMGLRFSSAILACEISGMYFLIPFLVLINFIISKFMQNRYSKRLSDLLYNKLIDKDKENDF